MRLRMVRNLVQNSDDELRESRMGVIIKQVKSIIITGKIESALNGFDEYQVQEEQDKHKLLLDVPSIAQKLYKLEEHPLLYGQVAIIGLENIDLCDKFYSLFECDRTAIDRALLTRRCDYWQDCGWKSLGEQYQAGSSNDSSWMSLFHKSNSHFDATKDALISLLKILPNGETFSNEFLGNLIQTYIKQCKEKRLYDWRYYYLSYNEFCPQSHGLYRFNNCGNNRWYEITALKTPRKLSNASYAPFLFAIKNKIGEGKFVGEFNQELNIRSMVVKCVNSGFVIKKGGKEERLNIEQNDDHIDKEERIEKIVDYIRGV